jgi:hypothetical protein
MKGVSVLNAVYVFDKKELILQSFAVSFPRQFNGMDHGRVDDAAMR